ncbi:MAG: hypothetical protein ACI4MP_12015 [Candidatus Ventricola sp.]
MKALPIGENAPWGGEGMPVLYKKPTHRERSKYRAAEAAGLLDRVLEVGWAGLSAKESGRIGGILAHMDQEKTKDDVR